MNTCIIEGCKNPVKNILNLDPNDFMLDFLPKPTHCEEHTPKDTRPYKKRTLTQLLKEKRDNNCDNNRDNDSSDDSDNDPFDNKKYEKGKEYESMLLKLDTTEKRTDFKNFLRRMNRHHFCIVKGCVNTASYNYMGNGTEPRWCCIHSDNEMSLSSTLEYYEKYIF